MEISNYYKGVCLSLSDGEINDYEFEYYIMNIFKNVNIFMTSKEIKEKLIPLYTKNLSKLCINRKLNRMCRGGILKKHIYKDFTVRYSLKPRGRCIE